MRNFKQTQPNLNRRRVRGMTLLEVLVALAIFATAAISVIRSVSQHINTVSYLEEKMFAAMVVDNQMANVMLDTGALKAKNGTEELAGRTWYWKVTSVATTQPLLKAFDVSVATAKNASPVVTVRSYVAQ
ncbi:type II secretion system minor pseudopilin GspI [Vibrio parahaemolyticus]|uniref:type II secretion system minor pseudopilin GspI n=1 Tax=Vibrio parahaemolyticus TaxID=670 RepID=UPI001123ACE9|nr:type II secretion system minor pseudopilin GspI [Vibrio parahaemolyticus]MDS1867137.1 type II secretion system minor pseudopilin GspI [Vibrio parahaemolyticus]QUD92261.1 type II secretion system minor pseudopilin GspI [Vibrio parahaemolyticus]TOJ10242.1 type II secretion system protein GspI [Vibrio parahaemolyticus]HCG5933453.1 type II secretion system minor pseudopilin GspI [Vibrio parahaemolyticus]HCG7061278.1 type II secretion system minor pseudopilin GspI [Vibrio parahaemolyticus]